MDPGIVGEDLPSKEDSLTPDRSSPWIFLLPLPVRLRDVLPTDVEETKVDDVQLDNLILSQLKHLAHEVVGSGGLIKGNFGGISLPGCHIQFLLNIIECQLWTLIQDGVVPKQIYRGIPWTVLVDWRKVLEVGEMTELGVNEESICRLHTRFTSVSWGEWRVVRDSEGHLALVDQEELPVLIQRIGTSNDPVLLERTQGLAEEGVCHRGKHVVLGWEINPTSCAGKLRGGCHHGHDLAVSDSRSGRTKVNQLPSIVRLKGNAVLWKGDSFQVRTPCSIK